jgi:hypothetical protein
VHICPLIAQLLLIFERGFVFLKNHQEPQKVLKPCKFGNSESEKEEADLFSDCLAAKECCHDTSEKERSYNLQKTKIILKVTFLCFEETEISFNRS